MAILIDKLNLPDFGFDFLNVTDQVSDSDLILTKYSYSKLKIVHKNKIKADLVDLSETRIFVTFGLVLLIWEIIPAFVIIILFRVKIINNDVEPEPSLSSSSSIIRKRTLFGKNFKRLFQFRNANKQSSLLSNENINSLKNDSAKPFYSTFNDATNRSATTSGTTTLAASNKKSIFLDTNNKNDLNYDDEPCENEYDEQINNNTTYSDDMEDDQVDDLDEYDEIDTDECD